MPDLFVAELDQRIQEMVHHDPLWKTHVCDPGDGLRGSRDDVIFVDVAWFCGEERRVVGAQGAAEGLEQLDPVPQAGPLQAGAQRLHFGIGHAIVGTARQADEDQVLRRPLVEIDQLAHALPGLAFQLHGLVQLGDG